MRKARKAKEAQDTYPMLPGPSLLSSTRVSATEIENSLATCASIRRQATCVLEQFQGGPGTRRRKKGKQKQIQSIWTICDFKTRFPFVFVFVHGQQAASRAFGSVVPDRLRRRQTQLSGRPRRTAFCMWHGWKPRLLAFCVAYWF